MNYETISVRVLFDGQVSEITLDAPPANILDARMMAEIEAQLDREKDESGRKLIVFQGRGRHFCFGASVKEHQKDQVGAMLPAFHRLIGKILDHPVPTLAKVRGQCLGGGFELALACGFIVADAEAKFAVPEIKLGVFPPVAALLLPFLAGGALAGRMVVTGETVSAETLQKAGLIGTIAAGDGLDGAVTRFIEEQIVPKSASSLRFAQRASRWALVRHYRDNIGDLERLYLDELMASADANEGIAAFIEKRSPEWRHA